MFGAYTRAAAYAAFGALFAAIFNKIMAPFLTLMGNAPGAQGSQLLAGFQALEGNVLLIIIFAIALGLLARAVVESQVGGFGP